MLVQRIVVVLALAVGLSIAALATAQADEPDAQRADKPKLKLNRDLAVPAEKNPDKPSDKEQEAAKKTETKDRFAVPEGGVKELLAFIQDNIKFRARTLEELREWGAAMRKAAEKVKQIATEEDKKLPGFADVEGLLLHFRGQEARQASPEERAKLLDDLKKYFAENPKPSEYGISAGKQLAIVLEYGDDPKAAIPVYQELGVALASSSDPQAAKTGLRMEGAARRLDLVGKPLQISGTALDGTKFDWNSLRGKVVLVDFWATWCGPCRAELPNVQKNYKLYHDKGFDVVGISLDDNRAALEKFIADEQNPWITLHDGGWNDNDIATYYGIMGIPTVLLVDKQGKVVDTDARGPKLGKLLEELLGPPTNAGSPSRAVNTMKQIALALQYYHDRNKQFPPAVVIGPDRKTPHSWRVELLPYFENEKLNRLYAEYKLDEPWDSEHNRKIIAPAAEFWGTSSNEPNGDSAYFMLVGPGTAFDPADAKPTIRKITDGTSKTIGVVEAKRDIPWTKPEDIAYDPDKPLPSLGGFFNGGFNALYVDGSVHFLPDDIDEESLRALISARGDEIINLDGAAPKVQRRK